MQPIDVLRSACRERGLPLTAQRKGVYEFLHGRYDHPTADQVYDAVRKRLTGISRATVYRILANLVDWGLAGKIATDRRGVRFDGNVHDHHHLHCTRCDRVVDCAAQAVKVTAPPASRRDGFRIESYSVVFRGLCSNCTRKEP